MKGIIYHGEGQLCSWSETSTRGSMVTFWLPDSESLEPFKALTARKGGKAGQIVTLTVGDVDVLAAEAEKEAKREPEKSAHGEFYRKLHASGFFNNPALWALAGSDEQYQAHIRTLPSCYSGDYSEYHNGEGRCEYAHVRRAGMSGTGYKPPYMGVPLTHAEHALQHQKGYGALNEGGIDWFEKQAVMYRTNWVKDWLRSHFCVESIREVDPAVFVAEMQSLGVNV